MCNCPKRVKEYIQDIDKSNLDLKRKNFLTVLIDMILNYERMLNEYRFELYLILKDYPELLHFFYFNGKELREYLSLISFRVIKKEISNDIQIINYIRCFNRKTFIQE